MKKYLLLVQALVVTTILWSQGNSVQALFYEIKTIKATPVKNQAMTGTCWCFSTTSLVESEEIRKEKKEIDLSEMFTVRNIYLYRKGKKLYTAPGSYAVWRRRFGTRYDPCN
ncbi:MAG: C1 family peptidase [Bacteroidota bacterium]|nr:C1 family peptidase [Bacteroidota bacterium]